jgi:hypothetical protein
MTNDTKSAEEEGKLGEKEKCDAKWKSQGH